MRAANFSKSINFMFLALSAALIYAVSNGIRVNLSLLLDPITYKTGVSYAQLSFILAIGQFVYGLSQPLFGFMALKYSYKEVLLAGCALLAIGLIGTAYSSSFIGICFFLGFCFYASTGALCFGIVLSCVSPLMTPYHAIVFSGILNTAAGVGSSFFSPAFSILLTNFDVSSALLILTTPLLLLVPISLVIGKLNSNVVIKDTHEKLPIKGVFRQAFLDKSYQIMLISFFICGFHMGIIFTHLYPEFIASGLSAQSATLAYTLLGIAIAIGAFLCGIACVKYKYANILGSLYFMRALIVASYVFFMPKNEISAVIFAFLLGLTCDATVAPTSLIVNARFGASKLAVLFGLVYIAHQLGCFVSAALGGILVSLFDSYEIIWVIDISLCLLASTLCFNIKLPSSVKPHSLATV